MLSSSFSMEKSTSLSRQAHNSRSHDDHKMKLKPNKMRCEQLTNIFDLCNNRNCISDIFLLILDSITSHRCSQCSLCIQQTGNIELVLTMKPLNLTMSEVLQMRSPRSKLHHLYHVCRRVAFGRHDIDEKSDLLKNPLPSWKSSRAFIVQISASNLLGLLLQGLIESFRPRSFEDKHRLGENFLASFELSGGNYDDEKSSPN
jgi:hypothetical protein